MAQGPAVPSFILRGHASAVHALHFFCLNTYLASADSDGWIVVWMVTSKRPLAVWKGHEGGVLGLKHWTDDRLISHGRDHVLRVWQLRESDFQDVDIKLPVDGAVADQCKQPWLLHSMTANALNYCAFSMCEVAPGQELSSVDGNEEHLPLLVATPNGLDAGGVDIFQLPSQHRVCKLASDKSIQTGMVMAVSLIGQISQTLLTLVTGYESGHIMVHRRREEGHADGTWQWERLMVCQPHLQPVLSIDVTGDAQYFFSSSADSVIAKFAVPQNKIMGATPEKSAGTKHAGQQDITVRDDGKIVATAGWDKRVRVYSAKTLKELAVLKWHQEGCYSLAFALTDTGKVRKTTSELEIARDVSKSAVDLLREEQSSREQQKHWLAAGSKDGKISLWDIY